MESTPHFWFDVPQPPRLSRGLIFIKWLLIIPHTFILYFYGIAAALVSMVAWFAILFTGQFPQGMWEFCYGYQRWYTRVSVYTTLLRDEYPPFGEAPYPMDLFIQRPQQSSRLLLFGRIFMIIPLAIWAAVLGVIFAVCGVIAFFTILFTGTIPTAIWEWLVGVLRYSVRINCWTMLLFDTWPGFSMENPVA